MMGNRHSGVTVAVLRVVRVSRGPVARTMTCWVSVVVLWDPRAVTVWVSEGEQRVVTVACGRVVVVLVDEALERMADDARAETVRVKVLTRTTEGDKLMTICHFPVDMKAYGRVLRDVSVESANEYLSTCTIPISEYRHRSSVLCSNTGTPDRLVP